MAELLVLIKHDCETCALALPALAAAASGVENLRIVSQSSREETDALSARLGLDAIDLDTGLALSERFDPDAVPALLLLEGDAERGRVEGLERDAIVALAREAGIELAVEGWPAQRPGCASLTRDAVVEARLRVRRARREGRIQSPSIRIGALEDPFEAMDRRGFTDGLPVVPPTPERVLAMLDHTRRDPQEVVGIVPPYLHPATVETVAINAVMAGCPGPAFPVVLAALDGVLEESFSLHGVIATTNPVGPLLVVSGPLAQDIGMNAEGNCLGQGNRANLGIGRALQLVLRNVGGALPGLDDRATLGQMGKLAACFAERSWDSPWASLSVERGLTPEDTGVTVFAAEGPRVVPDAWSASPESLAATYAMAVDAIYHPKQRNLLAPIVVVPPSCAEVFRKAGWDKARVKWEVWERTRRPLEDVLPGALGCEPGLPDAEIPADRQGVPKVPAPEDIVLIHAGGDAGSMTGVMAYFPASPRGSVPVTRRVEDWQ